MEVHVIDHNSSMLRVRVVKIVISLCEVVNMETEDAQPLSPSLCTGSLWQVRSFGSHHQWY